MHTNSTVSHVRWCLQCLLVVAVALLVAQVYAACRPVEYKRCIGEIEKCDRDAPPICAANAHKASALCASQFHSCNSGTCCSDGSCKSDCTPMLPAGGNLTTVPIVWDNGSVNNRFLFSVPGIVTFVTDKQRAQYANDGRDAFHGSDWESDKKYYGCGVAVAQTALQYFGIRLSRDELNRRYIPSHKIPSWSPVNANKIYVRPSTLRQGLENALFDYAGIGYMQTPRGVGVRIESGASTSDISRHLANGYPVIVLTKNGGHFVLVVGQVGSNFNFVDSDLGPNSFVKAGAVEMKFQLDSTIAMNFQGDPWWRPGTIIYFEPNKESLPTCPTGQKDCNYPLGRCVPVAAYCCGTSGCDQPCKLGPSGSYCP